MPEQLPFWVLPAVTALGLLLLLVLEWKRPLRRDVEPKPRRIMRNLTTGGIAFAAITLVQTPLLVPAARWTTSQATAQGWGQLLITDSEEHSVAPGRAPSSLGT